LHHFTASALVLSAAAPQRKLVHGAPLSNAPERVPQQSAAKLFGQTASPRLRCLSRVSPAKICNLPSSGSARFSVAGQRNGNALEHRL
jgi:hypothetical protein